MNCKPQRILIIEDESSIRDAIADSLQQERYEVLTAPEGRIGLEVIRPSLLPDADTGVDLLILDLLLPDMNGLDVCQFIRRQGSNLPILIISAKTEESDRVIGLEVGADDYLSKPFGMRELIARCRALLRRWDAPPKVPVLLQVRDIVLDLQTVSVQVRGKAITLSPKEMQLLEFFMQHPQKVWSREQLMKRIWGKDFIGDYKTLDVHIRWLREKLEVNPSRPEYLITMRGFGYRFG